MDLLTINLVEEVPPTGVKLQLTIKQRKNIPVLVFDRIKDKESFNTEKQKVDKRPYNDITGKIVIGYTYTVAVGGIKMTLNEVSFDKLVKVLLI
jgi:GH24 family phage-related lysozyme (muramidase)